MSTLPPPGEYSIDAVHSTVAFISRHLVAAKVRGRFSEFAGTISVGDSAATSHVEATVQAASITTDNEARDAHLKSPDFLDFENHPTLDLKSTTLRETGNDEYELVADLTIRGVTKSVIFDLTFLGSGPHMMPGVTVAGFEARTEIDRRDFNVSFEGLLENGAAVVGHKIIIELDVEAHLKA